MGHFLDVVGPKCSTLADLVQSAIQFLLRCGNENL